MTACRPIYAPQGVQCRREIAAMPDFPEVAFDLGYRRTNLYGGTRHSSVRALRKYRSPEEIKRAAMSETNKAFERYMGKDTDDDLRSVYQQSAEVVEFKKQEEAK